MLFLLFYSYDVITAGIDLKTLGKFLASIEYHQNLIVYRMFSHLMCRPAHVAKFLIRVFSMGGDTNK